MLLGAIALVLVILLSAGFAVLPAMAIPLTVLVELGAASLVTPVAMVGPFHVYAGDLLAVALAVATLIRLRQHGTAVRPTGPLVVFLAILLLGVLRGVAAFGIQPSLVAGRQMLAMLTAAVFFSTVRVTPELVRVLRNWLLLASCVLVTVAAIFWLQHGFGTFAVTGARALNALQALIVLETTIVVVVFPPFRALVFRSLVPLCGLIVVVLSTQRTVWAAGLVAAAVLVVVRQKSRGSTSPGGRRLVVVAAVLAVVLLVGAGPPGVTSSLTAGYQQTSATQNSTFSWRIQGWSDLINRQITGSGTDLAVGSPSGTGNQRLINGSVVNVEAHSEYVSTLTGTGLIGLALLIWLYVVALRRSRRQLRSPSAFVGQVALLFVTILALQLTYFVGYSSGGLVGLMLGLACGFVPASDEAPPAEGLQHLMPATTTQNSLLMRTPATATAFFERYRPGDQGL